MRDMRHVRHMPSVASCLGTRVPAVSVIVLDGRMLPWASSGDSRKKLKVSCMKDIVDRELIDELPVRLRGFRLLF